MLFWNKRCVVRGFLSFTFLFHVNAPWQIPDVYGQNRLKNEPVCFGGGSQLKTLPEGFTMLAANIGPSGNPRATPTKQADCWWGKHTQCLPPRLQGLRPYKAIPPGSRCGTPPPYCCPNTNNPPPCKTGEYQPIDQRPPPPSQGLPDKVEVCWYAKYKKCVPRFRAQRFRPTHPPCIGVKVPAICCPNTNDPPPCGTIHLGTPTDTSGPGYQVPPTVTPPPVTTPPETEQAPPPVEIPVVDFSEAAAASTAKEEKIRTEHQASMREGKEEARRNQEELKRKMKEYDARAKKQASKWAGPKKKYKFPTIKKKKKIRLKGLPARIKRVNGEIAQINLSIRKLRKTLGNPANPPIRQKKIRGKIRNLKVDLLSKEDVLDALQARQSKFQKRKGKSKGMSPKEERIRKLKQELKNLERE